ncbi:hypothetical protein Ppro_0881 [Pelobacter propionicus DSM 2379]|uniref:Uncharacterized protein n=1 Tax=Pelobacter propionicus (strain DSM 2379 / NBRC 103807 / OttBd1) TaxID=338966 RepID=A1AME0_PELPD|nr:hypothetical protein Ppro_0881 [Pelobacter propionicus DSM 2379]
MLTTGGDVIHPHHPRSPPTQKRGVAHRRPSFYLPQGILCHFPAHKPIARADRANFRANNRKPAAHTPVTQGEPCPAKRVSTLLARLGEKSSVTLHNRTPLALRAGNPAPVMLRNSHDNGKAL